MGGTEGRISLIFGFSRYSVRYMREKYGGVGGPWRGLGEGNKGGKEV